MPLHKAADEHSSYWRTAAPRAAATAPAATPWPTTAPAPGPSWATATCTTPSTTTPGWPTPRSCPTSAKTPPPPFWTRAAAFFASCGIDRIDRVLTDNGSCYRSRAWRAALDDTGVVHKRTRPYRPQTNGKVERFNRTLCDEWAYLRTYRSEAERTRRFDRWLHDYNHHRGHTALDGRPPIEAVNNLPRQYI